MSLYCKYKKCNKPTCSACSSGKGHGPYWFSSRTVNGRTVETYLGRQLPVSSEIGRMQQNPLVGRNEELDLLRKRLALIKHLARKRGTPPYPIGTILLTGEAGMGKTRLAEEAAREAKRRNWAVVWCRAYAQESNVPYHLWAETLRKAMSQGRWQHQEVTRHPLIYQPLHMLLPELQELLPPTLQSMPLEQEQLRLWESTRTLLGTISEGTTLLIVLDDLQWADHSSCELLTYLVRQMRGQPVMFLCTCRDAELPVNHPLRGLFTDLQREQAVELLPVKPLSETEIHQLIGHLPEPVLKHIANRACGNPFFAEELARSFTIGTLHSTNPDQLPQTIQAVLDLRLARISPDCQHILERGAVLGSSFQFNTILDMASGGAPADEDEILDLLEEALQAGMLTEEGSGKQITYHFWHPLLPTYLYDRLSAARRASLHRRAAQVLQNLYNDREAEFAAQITDHLMKGDASPALIPHYAKIAADRAYSLSAYPDAEKYYHLALGPQTMVSSLDHEIASQREILELLGECTRIQGDITAARMHYEQALQLYQRDSLSLLSHTTEEIQALLWTEIGLCWYDEQDLAQARQCYRRAEELLHEAGQEKSFAWARLRYEQGYCFWREGKYAEARSLAYEALLIFSRGSETQGAFTSHMTRLGRTLAGDPVDLGRVHSLLGSIADGSGQPEEAFAEFLEARAIYEHYHQTRELAIVCCNLGDCYLRQAAYKRAGDMLRQALDLAQRMNYVALISFASGNLAVVALRQGQWLVADTFIKQALTLASQHNDTVSTSLWSSYAAQIDLAQHRLPEARAHVAQALVQARRCRFEPYLALAMVTAASFHLTSCQQTVLSSASTGSSRKVKQMLQRVFSLSGIEAETRIEAQLVAAQLAALEGDKAASQGYARLALEGAGKGGMEWLIPLARKWLS